MTEPNGVLRDDFNIDYHTNHLCHHHHHHRRHHHRHGMLQVIALCKMISMQGLRLTNGHTLILFGELFRIYQKISNKVSNHCNAFIGSLLTKFDLYN